MVIFRILTLIFVLILSMALPMPASAAEKEEAMKENLYIFTPRIWLGYYIGPKESEDIQETFMMPMYGGTFTFVPKALPDLNFLATIFHGSGNGKLLERDTAFSGKIESTRTDYEVLVRYNVIGAKFYLLGGLRYVSFDLKESWDPFPFKSTTNAKVIGPELGFGASVYLTQDNKHQIFSNLVVLFGSYTHDYSDTTRFTESRSFFAPGIDLNIGYQYWVTPKINVSARYRTFTFYYEGKNNNRTYSDLVVFHGPEFGVSFLF
jgi:hypothetical protein